MFGVIFFFGMDILKDILISSHLREHQKTKKTKQMQMVRRRVDG